MYCVFSGAIPSELGKLTDVATFYLYSNSLNGAIPSELGDMTSVTDFAVSANYLTGM